MLSEDFVIQNSIPSKRVKIPGVYFLIFKSKIVYVGKAKDLVGRVRGHIKSRKFRFSSYYFLETHGMPHSCLSDDHHLRALERKYIETFKPKYNKAHNPDYIPPPRISNRKSSKI